MSGLAGFGSGSGDPDKADTHPDNPDSDPDSPLLSGLSAIGRIGLVECNR